MARKKISEWKAKSLLLTALDRDYEGVSVALNEDYTTSLSVLDKDTRYVVKVDEGIKKRMKKGLVALNKTPEEVSPELKKMHDKGYSHAIIEPFVPHDQASEKYISLERTRAGLQILFSEKGGIYIEENQATIQQFHISYNEKNKNEEEKISKQLNIPFNIFSKLIEAFDLYQLSFLEINPFVIEDGRYYLLDVAAEVDSAGEFFVNESWTADDLRSGDIKQKTDEEVTITKLSQKSQASFMLNVLNPDGSVFVLLSGGGASIVLADEVHNLGLGRELANYGEYSGNPNAEEVYLYTKAILHLLIHSNSSKKVLVIGGAVANFTDIRITFTGLIKALEEVHEELQKQHVKVYVRRGGPHQQEGLSMMEAFLKENELYGFVGDQTTALPEIVQKAVAEIQ